MRTFTILTIISSALNYKLNETTGYYENNFNNEKGLLDFLSINNTTINKVRRNSDNVVFTVGDRLDTGDLILRIDINKNEVKLATSSNRGGTNDLITLTQAVKYVEPTQSLPVSNRTTVRNITVADANIPQGDRALLDIQSTIINLFNGRQIRLQRLLKRRTETPLEFLHEFFTNWNNSRDTIFVDDSTVQTEREKRRSLGDIYMIMLYYYPTITLKEVLTMLYSTLRPKFNTGFRTSMCNRINKRVWYFDPEDVNGELNTSSIDEYGHRIEWYKNRIN